MAYTVHHERVPASGVEHSVAVQFTRPDSSDSVPTWPLHRGRLICHVVVARDDVLRVYEVRSADGLLSLVHVRMHKLFGQVTGICAVRTLATQADGRERLLVSFLDAKLALMEWDDVQADLAPISLHTFERAEQLTAGLPLGFVPRMLTDPASRCAALVLPRDTLAILPLVQDVTDLGADDTKDDNVLDQVPYLPSFLLTFGAAVDSSIRNVRDCVFLPGFQKPTLAVLYEPELTWTGSLSRASCTMRACLVTLDMTVSQYPITVTSEMLPYDAMYLIPCPEALGGVLVLTPNAILHLDQTARMIGVSVSGWTSKTVPTMELRRANELGTGVELDMRESVLAFTGDRSALVSLRDGRMYTLGFGVEGRTVTTITLAAVHIGQSRHSGASAMHAIPGEKAILCASMQEDTFLYSMEDNSAEEPMTSAPVDTTLNADMDADELDLYGAPSATKVALTSSAPRITLHVLDKVVTLAPLNDVAHGHVRNERGIVEPCMIAAFEHGLGAFKPQLQCEHMETIAPAQDVWTVRARGTNLLLAAWGDECLVYKLDEPAPAFVGQRSGRTLACGTVVDGHAVRVTPTHIEVLDELAQLVQSIEVGGEFTRACITNSFIALWANGVAHIWEWQREQSVWTRSSVCIPCAHMDMWEDDGVLDVCTWLVCVTSGGQVALHLLPDGTRQWQSCASLSALPQTLTEAGPELRPSTDSEESSGIDLEVALVKLSVVGDIPLFTVQYTQGQLAMYDVRKVRGTLVFTLAKASMMSAPCEAAVPFTGFGGRACLALSGPHSLILVRDRRAPLVLLDMDVPVTSLSPHAHEWSSVGVHDGHACILTWSSAELDAPVPYVRWSTGRAYTHVAIHDETACFVAASAQPTQFVLYGEDEQPIRDPAQDPTPTYTVRGALELFVRTGEPPIHGVEFDACESVAAVHMAPLDCLDRGSGRRVFVTVGTVITHGEDRTTRGFMYVFDVVACVPSEGTAPSDAMRLRRLYAEEMRGPVTALHDMNGFLVAAVGQKLLVRSWEFSEWLVTIAFLDLGMYTTDIQRVKNFLLVTDMDQGAYFVAFQEDPAKLVLLGRDYTRTPVVQGALLIDRSRLAIISCAAHSGCIRLVDYIPSNPTSLGGQRLLTRCEFHTSGAAVRARMLHGPRMGVNGECFTSEVVLAKQNGAVDVLVPVTDRIFPTLQLFQSQLVRAVPHTAGLNPRGFRTVLHPHITRPLTKGILDGTLLLTANGMPRSHLLRLVRDLSPRTGGVVADDLLRCLVHLQPHW